MPVTFRLLATEIKVKSISFGYGLGFGFGYGLNITAGLKNIYEWMETQKNKRTYYVIIFENAPKINFWKWNQKFGYSNQFFLWRRNISDSTFSYKLMLNSNQHKNRQFFLEFSILKSLFIYSNWSTDSIGVTINVIGIWKMIHIRENCKHEEKFMCHFLCRIGFQFNIVK